MTIALNRTAKDALRLLPLCLGALYLHGCLELIRRPPAGVPIVYGPAVGTASTADTTRNSSDATVVQDGQGAKSPAPIVVVERPVRSRQQRQGIEQVNEYALWCINNAMWNEARSHMERALEQDSLSASLHNNLGIIYERLGMVDKAADFYGRAQGLNPGQKAYAANLSYLQQRQQATRDTTDVFNIFKLDGDPRRQGTRRPDAPPTFTGE